MNNFILQEVSDRSLEKLWLRFPSVLYKDDPNYVRPLDEDVQKLFDKEQNKRL